ncbi:MAG: threonine synthase [Firmicutes bacterium]|nr:threonine synthase [Bacillota bacterium]
MEYISTRNKKNKTDSLRAVIKGLAEDGGLFVPAVIPPSGLTKEKLLSLSYDELAMHILGVLLPEYGESRIREIVTEGYRDKFDVPGRVALRHAGDYSFLELYHGPTSAFKDMALCLLPRLLTAANSLTGNPDKVMILTATSGDTGKAALEAFADVPDTGITVFYPAEGVSDIQKLQMQTQKGGNVRVCGIEGNFDDAQTGVKKAFEDVHVKGVSLGSANSINIGRLTPQVAYYFYAYAQMVRDKKLEYGEKLNFSVPTGNFGDILAGWIAKKMGLPVGRLLCASNRNRILTDFLESGIYDRRRDFYLTASPSMDILISSNLERLLFYGLGMDDEALLGLMKDLAGKGWYKASPELMDFIRADFCGASADDEEAFASIKELWEKENYLMDTHTAVACACMEKAKLKGKTVILSTASPYKFSASVLEALGEEVPEGCFEAMDKLEKITGVPKPERLGSLKEKTVLHRDVITPAEINDYVERAANDLR